MTINELRFRKNGKNSSKTFLDTTVNHKNSNEPNSRKTLTINYLASFTTF